MQNLIKTFSINSNIWTLNKIEEIDLNISFKLLVSDSGNFVEILIPQIFSRFFSFSNTYLPFFPSHHFFSVNSQTPPPSPLQPHPNGNLSMTGNLSGLRTISWNTIAVKKMCESKQWDIPNIFILLQKASTEVCGGCWWTGLLSR